MLIMKLPTLTLVILFAGLGPIKGQEITGRWHSADSTRTYRVYEKQDLSEAVLESSARITDKPGALILSLVEKKNTAHYRGIIHSADGEMLTTVKITLKGDVMKLRLRRFLMPAVIKWYRVEEGD